MEGFCTVDLPILKLEDRRQMVHRVSVPLIEQISIDDVQMVLTLPCNVSVDRAKGEFRGLTYQDIIFLSSFCEVKDMRDLSVLLLRLVGHHYHPQTRYQMSYVCVLGFPLKRFGVIPKKLA